MECGKKRDKSCESTIAETRMPLCRQITTPLIIAKLLENIFSISMTGTAETKIKDKCSISKIQRYCDSFAES